MQLTKIFIYNGQKTCRHFYNKYCCNNSFRVCFCFAVPEAPVNLIAEVIHPTFITLTWRISRLSEGTTIAHVVSLIRGSERAHFNIPGDNPSFNATDLTPFTNYTFEVAVVRSAGGGPSARLTIRTNEDG